MPPRFDLSLSPFGARIEALTEAALEAEAAGFAGVWVYDHLSGASGKAQWVLDPWVSLAAIAVATRALQLGPLVLNTPARHPARIALAAATLQDLSGGRLLLGMGAGAGRDPHGEELDMVGLERLPAPARRSMTVESILAVRALWNNESFSGDHYRLDHPHSFLSPEPTPPIIVGANGPRMVELAADHADGVNLHSHEPDLETLCTVARVRSPRAGFVLSVEAPMTDEWMVGDGRRRLDALGLDRVMYRWNADLGIDAIRHAAATLGLSVGGGRPGAGRTPLP